MPIYVYQNAFQPSNLGNEREGKTGVAVEPELHWHIESVGGENIRSRGCYACELGEFINIADHGTVATFLFLSVGKFIPDIKPSRILLVNLRSTDFDFSGFDKTVAETSDPSNLETSA